MSIYTTWRALERDVRTGAREPRVKAPLPPLQPYRRCACGACRECRDNAKWDRIFAKFEVKEVDQSSFFRSPLDDL